MTAGIDFGLALMATIAGEDMARGAQLAIEYAPAPPFSSGTPDEALPQTLRQVTRLFEPFRQSLDAVIPLVLEPAPRGEPPANSRRAH